jgi:hypothetical protein
LSAVVPGAGAIGIGRLPTSATIGLTLDLAIPLRLEAGESLTPDCLAATVSFADNLQQPGTTTLRLEPARPDATERTLRLVTTTRVDEPIVTVELTLGCGSKVSRQFTLFADPPPVAATAAAEPPSVAAEPAASAPPRLGDVPVPQAQAEASPPPPPPRRAASAPPRRAAATAGRSASPAPAAPAGATARAPGGARLKLAPLEAGTAVADARARPGTSPPADAAASAAAPTAGAVSPGAIEAAALGAVAAAQEAASAASAARAAEAAAAARAAQLEEALQRARADSASAQNAIAALRADLDRMRSESRGSSPWLFDLLLLALVLALAAVVWLWRQRQQDREAAQWMQAGATETAAERGPEFEEPPESVSGLSSITSQTPALSSRVLADDDEFDDGGPSGRTGPITMPMPPGTVPAVIEPKREVSVEELIDLEQQAEFFVVLGQDEAAIDLLMGHLRSTSGTSPLPYLKLLEIYKRRGERKPYELLRERFNGRFSAIAPAWDTDWQTGRSLEDYPAVLERLESLWFSPARAMEVLQATLMRPAGPEHEAGAQVGFDLPAYRELMFLYAVARDRAETETGGGVDLLLPLGEPAPSEPPLMFERLVATTSLEAQPSVRQPLTVDLPIDESPTTTAAAVMLHGPTVDFDPSELPPLEPLPPRRTRE